MERITHKTLNCGIELACVEIPGRHIVALDFRFLAGTAHEPQDYLGLTRLIQDTIDLGTAKRDGRALSDAFDEIGASHGGWVGREASAYNTAVLPEYVDRAIELHAEFLRTPTFPQEKVDVALELSHQEWNALQDDAQGLADKLLSAQALGKHLGRHSLGEPQYLDRIKREHLVEHWRKTYHAGRMHVAAAGAFDTQKLIDSLERHFAGFGSPQRAGRDGFDIQFADRRVHHGKDLEQQQIGIAFPGTAADKPDYPVQRVMLSVLSGGMSSRLFTEVREKLGLVYWVSAWSENPRGGAILVLGASTTPERCETTYRTLLREVDRLGEDLTDAELNRSVTSLVAKIHTQGDVTRSRCSELAEDLFHFGRPMNRLEKIDKIKSVTVSDIHDFLAAHPRDALSVITLGPKVMEGMTVAAAGSNGSQGGSK